MSIYSRIFAATSKRLTSAAISGQKVPPLALWAFPGLVGVTWFIWGALTDDIKQSVGLYYDPDAVMKRVEAERAQRLEARDKLKAATKPKKDEADDEEEEDEENEDDEEEVTAKDIEAAVNKAVAAAKDDDDDDDGEGEDNAEGEDEEEEDEEPKKPKKPKVDFSKLSLQERWEYFAETSIVPGDDDEDEGDDDDDDDDDE